MAKKIKLIEAAKDINVPVQEIIDFFTKRGDTKKKAGSTLTEEDMNLVLEHYTKSNSVESFDSYFSSGSSEKSPRREHRGDRKPDSQHRRRDRNSGERRQRRNFGKDDRKSVPQDRRQEELVNTPTKSVEEKKQQESVSTENHAVATVAEPAIYSSAVVSCRVFR